MCAPIAEGFPCSHCSLPHPHPEPRGSTHPKPMTESAISQQAGCAARLPLGCHSCSAGLTQSSRSVQRDFSLNYPQLHSLSADAPPHSSAVVTPLPTVLSVMLSYRGAKHRSETKLKPQSELPTSPLMTPF